MSDPFLRWAGSKKRITKHLGFHWHSGDFRRYVEPFAGSAALFFHLEPRRALISDINLDLIDTYIAVKKHPIAVSNRLDQLPLGEEPYYNLRDRPPKNLDLPARAARFIFLNRYCFNGLYRTNKQGAFNVPYAPTRTGRIPSRTDLKNVAHTLSNVEIRQGDFAKILTDNVRPGDFVYLDPPYATENRRVFKQYGPTTFGVADLERLTMVLKAIDRVGAAFLLSYGKCTEIEGISGSWSSEEVEVQRNISGFAKSRRVDTEIIVTNLPQVGVL